MCVYIVILVSNHNGQEKVKVFGFGPKLLVVLSQTIPNVSKISTAQLKYTLLTELIHDDT